MKKILILLLIVISFSTFGQDTRGFSVSASNSPITPGQTYAVIVGISTYQHIPQLKYADRDAKAFYDFLLSKSGGSIDSDNIKLLLNEKATGYAIRSAINHWLMEEKKPQRNDVVYIYFAGHGDALSAEESYLLGWDTDNGDPNVVYDGGYNIDIYHLKLRIKKLTDDGVKVILITDACRGNELPPGGEKGRQSLESNIMEMKEGEIQFTSCSAGEVSLEDRAWGGGRGLFSYWLINGLYGLADKNNDGFVTVGELKEYLTDSVNAATKNKDKSGKISYGQNPFYCCSEDDNTTLAKVNPQKKAEIAAAIKQNQGEQLLVFNRGRGISDSWSNLPDTVKTLYNKFEKQIDKGSLTDPDSACAYTSYKKLINDSLPEQFKASIKDELTTALIDSSQQIMNSYIDYKRTIYVHYWMPRIIQTSSLYLGIAMNLVGKDDEIYPVLNRNRLIMDANNYLNNNNLQRMNMINQALLKLDSANLITSKPSAVLNLTYGVIFAEMGKYKRAIKADSLANIIAPTWFKPLLELGINYERLLQYDKAKLYFLRAWRIDSTDLNVLDNLQDAFEGSKQHDEALKFYNNILKLDSNNINVLRKIGSLYVEQNIYDKAESYYIKAYLKSPSDFLTKIYLENLYDKEKKYDEEEQYYIKDTSYWGLINLGNFYLKRKEFDKAESCFLKVQNRDPTPGYLDNTPAYNLISLYFIYDKEQKFDSAKICFQKIDWNSPEVFGAAAEISLSKYNDTTKAEEFYLKAIKLDSTNNFCSYNIACIYSLKHEESKALKFLSSAIRNGFNDFAHIQEDTDLDNIRNTAEFKALMKKYLLDENQE